jgi:hypothetical protein
MAVEEWDVLDAELADTIEEERQRQTTPSEWRYCCYCGRILSDRNRYGACKQHFRLLARDPQRPPQVGKTPRG